MTSRQKQILGTLAATTILVALYFLWPGFRWNVDTIWVTLGTGDIQGFRNYLLGFGVWAPIVSGAAMILQSIAAPLPAFVITFANGLLFGAFWGTVLSWSSAMIGAIVCYYIAKFVGRPAVEKMVGTKSLELTDRFFNKYGKYAILIARLIPIISFDVVSYAAGLTSVSLLEFVVATGIGQLPATILYSYLGENVTSSAQIGLWVVIGVLTLLALGLAAKTYFEAKLAASAKNGAQN